MRRSLQDMVVVITGASAGIGKALAEALHARGAKLALAARRLDRIEALNQQLGGGHLAIQADVSDHAACESLIRQTVERFGPSRRALEKRSCRCSRPTCSARRTACTPPCQS